MSDNLKSKGHQHESNDGTLPFWRQLRWYLVLTFVILAVLPVIIATVISLTRTTEQARGQVINQLESVAELKRNQINRWLNDSRIVLDQFLTNPNTKARFVAFSTATLLDDTPPSEAEEVILSDLLQGLNKVNPNFEGFFLYNADGRIIAASDPIQIGKIVTSQPYFADSLTAEIIQTPYYEVGKNELTMLITSRLLNEESGQIAGVLAGRLDLDTLGQIMTERTGLGETGETYLVSLENNFLLTPSRFESEGYILTRAYRSEGIDRVLHGEDGFGIYDNYREPPVPVLGVYRWIPELDAGLLAEVEEAQALASAQETRNFNITVAAVAVLIAAAVGLYTTSRVSRPITVLTQVATRIAGGDLGQRIEIDQRDEIGLLATAFNRMTNQLQRTLNGLKERTRGLGLAAEVGRFLSTMRDLDTLLPEAVALIRSNFDLYYVQIYLTNPSGRAVVLRAGSGSVGKQLVQRGHRLPVGPGSINGTAAAEKRTVIVADTAESETFLPNPLLPDTRSEMAIPLIAGEHVVGVLNLQHDEPNTLNEEILSTFEALAGQLAIAIDNADLFAETEHARAQTEAYARRLAGQGWDDLLNAIDRSERLGFTYDAESISQLEEPLPAAGSDEHTLAVPVAVSGETIGTLHLESEEGRTWTDDEAELVTVVGKQVAQQVENLRLLAQAEQYRIEAEAAVRRTTREGWQAYVDSLAATQTGYSYDRNKVTPVTTPDTDDEVAMIRPITIYGEPIGELAIAETDELDDDATELLAIIAEQLSDHIEKARLTEETEKALGQTEDQAARLAALNKMSEELSRAAAINDIFKIIASEIGGIIEGDRTSVALLDQTDSMVEIYALNGETGTIPTGAILPLDETVVGRAIQDNILINIPDTRQDEMIDTRSIAEHGLYSTLVAPLATGQKVIGTLNIARTEPQAFVGRDEDLMRQVASLMASIIERKRAEEALKESEQKMSLHIQQTPLAVIEWNLDFEVTDWNPAAEKIFGFTEEEALGRHAAGLIVPESVKEIVDQVWSELLTQQGGTRSTNENITKDGQVIVCDWYNTPLIDNDGQVIGVASLVEDITESRRAEERTKTRLKVSEALAGTQTEDEVLDAMVQAADLDRQVRVALYTLDPEADELVCISRRDEAFDSGIVSTIPIGTRLSSSEFTMLQYVAANAPFITDNFLEDERVDEATRELTHKMGYASAAFLPITVGTEWLGLLVVVSKQEGFFDEHKLYLYQMLAEQGGIALHTTRLYDEIQRSSRELDSHARRLATLNEFSEELSRAPEINDIFKIIAEKIGGIIESDRTSMTLLDKTGDTLEVFALDGEVGIIPSGTKMPLEGTRVGQAIRENIVINTPDTSQVDTQSEEGRLVKHGLLSTLVVPMLTSDQMIGTLNVGSKKLNAFSERDEDLIRQVASLVASTIENKKLFEATQKSNIELENRTRELEASQQVTFAASEHTNPDELLNLVVNLIRDQFDLYHAQVYLVDQKQKMAVLKESTGYAGRQLLKRKHQIPLNSPSLVTKTIKTGKPILVADVSQDETWLPNDLLPHTQAELVVPLKVGGQILGALDVQSRSTDQLTKRTVALFQTMTDQVAFLFENSELLSHVSAQTTTLTRFTSQLRTAAEVTERLNTILDPDALMEEVVAMLQNRFDLYHTHIYLLDANEEALVLQAGSGELGKVMRERGHKIPLDREQSLVARAARNQEIVVVKDVSLEQNFMPNPLLPDTRSEVAIPLVASSGLLGILDMQDSRPERFEQTDLDTFSTLAGQVATALENARLFEETQQTAQRLRQVDRMKSEFLANMSHELRTPLNSIIGYSEMMLMGISGELPEDVTEDVQAIYDNGKHLLHVISDILDLAKIEAGRLNLQFEEVSVGTLLDEIKVNNAGLFMNKPIELMVEAEEDLPEFQADPVRINQIFNNLISNAAKFTPEGHVAVRASREGDWIAFEVEDTGVGISEVDMKEVFEKFMQADGSFTRRAEGTGLGLAITRHLIHLHGGEITVRSRPDVGTTFTIRLPLEHSPANEEEMVYEMAAAIPTNGTNS